MKRKRNRAKKTEEGDEAPPAKIRTISRQTSSKRQSAGQNILPSDRVLRSTGRRSGLSQNVEALPLQDINNGDSFLRTQTTSTQNLDLNNIPNKVKHSRKYKWTTVSNNRNHHSSSLTGQNAPIELILRKVLRKPSKTVDEKHSKILQSLVRHEKQNPLPRINRVKRVSKRKVKLKKLKQVDEKHSKILQSLARHEKQNPLPLINRVKRVSKPKVKLKKLKHKQVSLPVPLPPLPTPVFHPPPPKVVAITNEQPRPKVVAFTKPQPFSSKHDLTRRHITGKTGALIIPGRRGKLFPVKKKPKTADESTNSSHTYRSLSPQPGTSFQMSPPHTPLFSSRPPSDRPTPSTSQSGQIPLSTNRPISPQPSTSTPSFNNVSTQSSLPPSLEEHPLSKSSYEMLEHKRRYIQKYGVEEIIFKVAFSQDWLGTDIMDKYTDIYNMFEDLLNQIRSIYHHGVKCRIYINHPDLQYQTPIFIALRPLHLMNPDAILIAIEKVLNSNQSLKIDEHLEIHIGIMDVPKGGGCYIKLTRPNADDIFNEKFVKRSILIIPKNTKHPTCAARAIVCGAARLSLNKATYNRIADKRLLEQYYLAEKLLKAVRLPNDREIEISELEKFENFLNIQILVYSQPFQNKCIYVGCKEREDKIFLYHTDNHFDLITSMTGFLCHRYFCSHCKICYDNAKKHYCKIYCKTCENINCSIESEFSCYQCHQVCRSEACFIRHKTSSDDKCDNSSCNIYFICTKCKHLMKKTDRETHKCGSHKCTNCYKYVKGSHECYMRRILPPQTNGHFIFLISKLQLLTVQNVKMVIKR
jgi:hypothetical protein